MRARGERELNMKYLRVPFSINDDATQFENKTAVVYQILSPKTIYGVQKYMHLHLLLL